MPALWAERSFSDMCSGERISLGIYVPPNTYKNPFHCESPVMELAIGSPSLTYYFV